MDQYVVIRVRLTRIPGNIQRARAELWLNGKPVPGYFTTYFRKRNLLCIGADTNNEFTGWAEFLNMPLLSDAQAAKVFAELAAAYHTGKVIPYPYAAHIDIKRTAAGTSASYVFVNPLGYPEDTVKRVVRWIAWGSNGVSNAAYLPQFDGMLRIPRAITGRVEITVCDTRGNYFSLPESKAIN